MKRVIVMAAAAVLCACGGVKLPPYGGDKELAIGAGCIGIDTDSQRWKLIPHPLPSGNPGSSRTMA